MVDTERMRSYITEEPDTDRYKSYRDAIQSIDLPVPDAALADIPLSQALDCEGTQTLTRDELGRILSLTFGQIGQITGGRWQRSPMVRRTSPSGGARHPTEGYLLSLDVPDLPAGWYHVSCHPPQLELLRQERVSEAELREMFPLGYLRVPIQVSAILILTSVFGRNMYRYREPRTFRTVHMDAGHIAATAAIVASALGVRWHVSYPDNEEAIERRLNLNCLREGFMMTISFGKHPKSPETSNGQAAPASSEDRSFEPSRNIPVNAKAGPSNLWGPLITIRGTDSEAGKKLIISDALHRKRARVSASALLDLVASQYRQAKPTGAAQNLFRQLKELGWQPGASVDPETIDLLRTWWKRGWHPSLEYFLWSRNRPYVDAADANGEVREQVVGEYLKEGPPPAPQFPEEELPMAEPAALPEQATVGRLLMARHSVRAYGPIEVPASVLSSVLFRGLGDVREVRCLAKKNRLDYLKTHGIAFDFHLVVYRVRDLAAGVYRYDVARHRISQTREGDFREDMVSALVGMASPRTASWTLVITIDFPRYQWRYRHERALRHLYMASGRLAQRLLIVGEAFGLGTLPTPAIRDTQCCELLKIDPTREVPVYSLTMGPHPQQASSIGGVR